ncbi:DUF3784 domain-containing protein [Sabulilitoribacter multivorans]|uniref:DUF3784 domain-containing protein n=1 Tax=Flaviramulus multivorans TaxID=1304750 RepID=A0ABS9IG43_9FLAO|nr:DUF3784 domain-containing protein [Flaviramulus multivorans]MCF7559729.1 DUF3784 domain-containing protein [Flaviramulus multivorans]
MIVVAFIFIILGILIKHGKLYFLIAGYNTMPKEEKEKYDIEGVATVFRNTMFAMAFVIIIGFILSKWLNLPNIETYAFFVAIICGVPYLIIISNSNKYKINR